MESRVPILYLSLTHSTRYSPSLISISEFRILEVGQVIEEVGVTGFDFEVGALGGGLAVTFLVARDEQHAQAQREGDLARGAGKDELAARLVDGGLLGEEGVRSDHVARAVGEEHECCRCHSLGVSSYVCRR